MWASRVEKQAKVVNEVSTAFLETFKAHVHDLEDAMIALANTPTKEAALEVALHDTQTQLDQAQHALAEAKDQHAAAMREIESMKGAAEKSKNKSKQLNQQMEESTAKCESLEAQLAKSLGECDALKRQSESLRLAATTMQQEISHLQGLKDSCKCESLSTELDLMRKSQSMLENSHAGMSDALKSAQADLAAAKVQLEADEQDKSALNQQLKTAQDEVSEMAQESVVLREKLKSATDSNDQHIKRLQSLQDEMKALEAARNELERERTLRLETETSVSKLTEKQQATDAKLSELRQENNTLKAGLKSLSEDKEDAMRKAEQSEKLRQQAADKAADAVSEAGLLKVRLTELETKSGELQQSVQKAQAEKDTALEKVEEATAGIQKKLEAKTTECRILEGKLESMESAKLAEIENKSTEQAMYAEQLKDLEFKLMRSEEMREEVAKLGRVNESLRESNVALQSSKLDLELQIKSLSASQENIGTDLEKQKKEVASLTQKLENTVLALEGSKNDNQDLKLTIKDLGATNDSLEEKSNKQAKSISDLTTKLSVANEHLDSLKSEMDSRSKECKDLQSNKQGLELTTEKQSKQLADQTTLLEQVKALLEESKAKALDLRSQNKDLGISKANLQLDYDKRIKEISELNAKIGQLNKHLENVKSETLDAQAQLKELKGQNSNKQDSLKMTERHLADKESIIVQLKSAQRDLQKKVQEIQGALTDTEDSLSKSRSEVKALYEKLSEKSETVSARDLTIQALKIAQADNEKKMLELKETLSVSEAHFKGFAEDGKSKDGLIQRLQDKLKEQDSQWEKDIAALSQQLRECESKHAALEAESQQVQDEKRQLALDLREMQKHGGRLNEEKDSLSQQLLTSTETCKALEEKLLATRADGNALDAAKRKQDEDLAEIDKQLQFYMREAEVAAVDARKWREVEQKLEQELAVAQTKVKKLEKELTQAAASNEQLGLDVIKLKNERDAACSKQASQQIHFQAEIRKQQDAVTVVSEQLRDEFAAKQKREIEVKNATQIAQTAQKELAQVNHEFSSVKEICSKMEADLKKSQIDKNKERELVDNLKLQLKRAGDDMSVLKAKYDDEMSSCRKLEKTRDEYISKLNTTTEKLRKESVLTEEVTEQMKVLSKSKEMLERDVHNLKAQVERLESELKSQKQLRMNADAALGSATERQKQLEREIQTITSAMSKLEAAHADSVHSLKTTAEGKNASDAQVKKLTADVKDMHAQLAKEQALKTQLRGKAEEASSKFEEAEGLQMVLKSENKNLQDELKVTRKLIGDLEKKIKEQDEQWSYDVSLLKEKLASAKSEWTKYQGEARDLKLKNDELEVHMPQIREQLSSLRKSHADMRADNSKLRIALDEKTKLADAAVADKRAAVGSEEAAKKEKAAAVAKAQESERRWAESKKEKELAEQRLRDARQELESIKRTLKKEQEVVKSTQTARDTALNKCSKLETEVKTITEQKRMADEAVVKARAKESEADKAMQKAKSETNDLNERVSRNEKDAAALKIMLAERDAVIEALEQKIKDQDRQWDDDVQKLRHTLGETQRTLSEVKDNLSSAEATSANLQADLKRQHDKLDQVSKDYAGKVKSCDELKKLLDQNKKAYDDLEISLKAENEKSATLASQLAQARQAKKTSDDSNATRVGEFEVKIKNLLDKISTLENTVKALETAEKDLRQQVQDEARAKSRAQEELAKEVKSMAHLTAELEKERERCLLLQDRIASMEDQVERDQLETQDVAKKLQEALKSNRHSESELQRKEQTLLSLREKEKRLETELRDTAGEAAKQASVMTKVKAENSRMEIEIESVTTKLKALEESSNAKLKTLEQSLLESENKLQIEKTNLEKMTKAYNSLSEQSTKNLQETRAHLKSRTEQFQNDLNKLAKCIQPIQWELVAMETKTSKQAKLIAQLQPDLAEHQRHLGRALQQRDELKEEVSNLRPLESQLENLEKLNKELSRQKGLLVQALDADTGTLRGFIKMLQATGHKFFPDPFPERCQFKLPDRVWLVTIEFRDNRKVLDDLLHQTYIEEDFTKGQKNMVSLPGGLTKSKVDEFAILLKKALESHASSKTGLDRAALEDVAKSLWLSLNPGEVARSSAQAAVLADCMLDFVAPQPVFPADKLQGWLHEMTYIVADANGKGKQSLAARSRRDRHTLTTDVDDYDRSALWVHCCSLIEYFIQTCGRQIANLSTDELRLLQLNHFIRDEQQQQESSEEDEELKQDEFYSGQLDPEYWNQRDSDSTVSRGSLLDQFRVSWDLMQKKAAGGISAPSTPRLRGVSSSGNISSPRGHAKSGGETARSVSSWFMGDHLFEA